MPRRPSCLRGLINGKEKPLQHRGFERGCRTRSVSGSAGQMPPLVLEIYFVCQHRGCVAHALWGNNLYLMFPLWCPGWCLSVCHLVNGRFQFPCHSYIGEFLSASVDLGIRVSQSRILMYPRLKGAGLLCGVTKYKPHRCEHTKN